MGLRPGGELLRPEAGGGRAVSVRQDEPFEIQPRANGAMARVLQWAAIAALVLGMAAVVLPADVGRPFAWGSVALVVMAPLARVAWLAVRWVQRRDLRFAALAFSLLLVVALGAALAVLVR